MHNPQKVVNETITLKSKGMKYKEIVVILKEAGFRNSVGGLYTEAGLSAMVSYRKKKIKKGQQRARTVKAAKNNYKATEAKYGLNDNTKQFKAFIKTTIALSIPAQNKLRIIENAVDSLG